MDGWLGEWSPPPPLELGSIIQHGRRTITGGLWSGPPSDYDYNYDYDDDDADAEDPMEALVVLPSPPGSSATQGHAAVVPPSNKRGRAPASSKAIEGLPEVTAAAMDGSDDCCAICLQDFDACAGLRAMPCSHTFHQRCISEWLRRNAVCPLCRYELPTEEEDEDQLEQGRRSGRIRRIIYDEERGRHFMAFRLTEDPVITEEDEQELARLDSMVQGQMRTTPQS